MRPSAARHVHATLASSARSSSSSSSLSYCADVVRQASYETYTRAFCAYPPFVRATFFSLHALDCELLQIGDKASRSEQLASIRFQWWRDALASLHKDRATAPRHPVIDSLARLPTLDRLSAYHLSSLVRAREQHLLARAPSSSSSSAPFRTVDDVATLSNGTSARVLYLLLQAMERGPHADPTAHAELFQHASMSSHHDEYNATREASDSAAATTTTLDSSTVDHAATHLAVAQTLVSLLRTLTRDAQRFRQFNVPLDLAAGAGLTEEALFRKGPEAPGLREAVLEMHHIATSELNVSERLIRNALVSEHHHSRVPEIARPLLISAVPLRTWLATLDKLAFDVFSPALYKQPWSLPFQMWWASKWRV